MRNRRPRTTWWLAALPLILVVAVLASSQRMLNIHLAWELTTPVRATDRTAHLVQTYDHFGESHQLEVTVTVLKVSSLPEVQVGRQRLRPPPGGVLWQIDTEFQAPPDVVLYYCETVLFSDGVSYSPHAGKIDVDTGVGLTRNGNGLSCTPAETPGPQHEFTGPGIRPAEEPRPTRWQQSFSFALPAGVQPEEFRLWWHRPQYLSFPLTP